MTEQEVLTHFRVSCMVGASASDVFALLIDPDRHQEFDGSGLVRGAVNKEKLTEVGQVFQMNMHSEGQGDYVTENHVRSLATNADVSWMPTMNDRNPSGYWWGYDIRAIDDDSCEVGLYYDWAAITSERWKPLFPRVTQAQMQESLHHLQALFAN